LLTERYTRYPSDSRLQGEGRLELARRIAEQSAVWVSGRLEGRTYPENTVRSYHRAVASLGFGSPFHGGRFNLLWSIRGLDYCRTAYHDRTSRAVVFDYRRAIGDRTDIGALAEFEWSDYGRAAIKYTPPELPTPSGTQRDRAREARLSLRHVRGWLFECDLAWRSNRSNSFGFSTGTRSLEGGVSGWLPGSVLLQIRGRIESTSYRDHGLKDVYIPLEGEELEAAEDNNRLQVRLSRKLSHRLTAEGRISWFRNESLLVGEFYEKALGTLGLVWTPIGKSRN
jgi:hypothetical protein